MATSPLSKLDWHALSRFHWPQHAHDTYPSDTLKPNTELLNTDSGLQTVSDNNCAHVDNLALNVCSLFVKNKILSFNANDPSFNALIAEINDFSYWKYGVETAVRQKIAERPNANYVIAIVKNKWLQRADQFNGNVYSLGEPPERNTERDLRRRAEILGIVQGDDHFPGFRHRIESMERQRDAEAERARKVC